MQRLLKLAAVNGSGKGSFPHLGVLTSYHGDVESGGPPSLWSQAICPRQCPEMIDPASPGLCTGCHQGCGQGSTHMTMANLMKEVGLLVDGSFLCHLALV